MAKEQTGRLEYLDWVRGLAALIMVQGHAFDSWLHPRYRDGELFWFSQFLGGFPAPLFLFLMGASLAVVLDRMRAKKATRLQMLQRVFRRGFWILLLAYAFRVEQYWIWRPASRWSDIFRIDTLNCIAVCFVLIGLVSTALNTRRQNLIILGLLAAVVVLATPYVFLITSGGPGIIMDYLNGGGHLYYFSIFPWIAFALTGMAFGYAALEAKARGTEQRLFEWVAGTGIFAYAVGLTLPFFHLLEYGFYDYSVTGPAFFLIRIGWLSVILYGSYRWCRVRASGSRAGLRTVGQCSLLIYWSHMELVYGKPLHAFERMLTPADVMKQLVWLFPLMLVLAVAVRSRRAPRPVPAFEALHNPDQL